MFRFLLYMLLAIDAAGIFILLYSLARIPPGQTRRFFLFFMGVSLLWINSMFLVQYPGLSAAQAEAVSRLIFGAGILAMHAYGYFVIYFCDRKAEFRSARFLLFQLNQLVLLGLLAAGLITDGVHTNEFGLRTPVYGPAHPWFVASWVLWGLYVFAIGHYGYRRARDPVFRFQIRYLFYAGLLTFAFMVLAIGVLPRITALPFTSYAGGFSCLILFWGVINLLVNERSLFIRSAVKELLQRPAFRLRENVRALYRALYTIGRAFDTGDLDQRISFALAGGASEFQLRLSRGPAAGGDDNFRKRVLNLFQSEKYITGLIESQKNAQKENLRLALKVEELTRKLRERNGIDQEDSPRLTDDTLRVLAAQIDPDYENLEAVFTRDAALDALTEQEFNELVLTGLVEAVEELTDGFRLAPSAVREIAAGDDRPVLERILEHFDSPYLSQVSRTHAPRWHLSDGLAAGGGGSARVTRIAAEDALGEPEDFEEYRHFQNVSLHYGYQGSEITLCETGEPYTELLKAMVYDIFIGDGVYQFDCFYKWKQDWTKIRIEFVPGLTENGELLELPGSPAAPPGEGIYLLENSRSSFLDSPANDARRLTVAVREQYRKLGSLSGRRTVQFSFRLEDAPDDFVLYIGTGRRLQKLDLEPTGQRVWEGAGNFNGLFVRAVLSSENMRDFGLVVTREAPGDSAN